LYGTLTDIPLRIHKAKYNEKEKEKDDKADKKRSKSKPRKSMFFKSSS